MHKICSIIHYEYKMQIKRPAGWGVLLAASASALLDSFPSGSNLARLEFLRYPSYFIFRIMSIDTLILTFGLMFLLAGRFPLDSQTNVKSLMMAAPLHKAQYLSGKLIGSLLYMFSMLCIFLTTNTLVYFMAAPFEINPAACVIPLLKAIAFCVFPVSIFSAFCSVSVPAVMDIRLFYILAAAIFGYNAVYVGSAEAMPFYLITSGDLTRLIWTHPRWPQISMRNVLANGIFLAGSGLLSGSLLFLKQRLWRAE